MRSHRVTARIELTNLLRREKSALADAIGGDETMRTQAECLEPVGDDREVRDAAVVEGEHGRDSGSVIAASAPGALAGRRDPKLREAVELCLELRH